MSLVGKGEFVWIMNPPSRSSTHGPQGHITDLIVQISHKQAWSLGKEEPLSPLLPVLWSGPIRIRLLPPQGPAGHAPYLTSRLVFEKYALRRRSPAVTPRSLPAPPSGYFALGVLRRGASLPTDDPVALASGSFSVSLAANCAWVALSEEESSLGRRGDDYADLARAREGRWVAVGVGLREALKAWTARTPPGESARPLGAVDAWAAGLRGAGFISLLGWVRLWDWERCAFVLCDGDTEWVSFLWTWITQSSLSPPLLPGFSQTCMSPKECERCWEICFWVLQDTFQQESTYRLLRSEF